MKEIDIEKLLLDSKVLTLQQISERFDCSIRTVQRHFVRLKAIRSYNKNSKYFTLYKIAKFNAHGIWVFKDINFSKYGNLKTTVINIIRNSDSGLSSNEIGDILNLHPRSFMQHFKNLNGIYREKHSGVYIYFSNVPEILAEQKSKRILNVDIEHISDAIAVKILILYIKNPEISALEISAALKKENNIIIHANTISNFLSFHGLVKKNPDS